MSLAKIRRFLLLQFTVYSSTTIPDLNISPLWICDSDSFTDGGSSPYRGEWFSET